MVWVAIGLVLLLGVGADAAVPAGHANGRAPALTLQVADSPDGTLGAELAAFLTERATDTWGVAPRHTEAGAPLAGERFRVAIAWPSADRLLLHIFEAGKELAQREIPVMDPGATKLTVWLVVKSTINRALLEAGRPRAARTVGVPELAGAQRRAAQQAHAQSQRETISQAVGAPVSESRAQTTFESTEGPEDEATAESIGGPEDEAAAEARRALARARRAPPTKGLGVIVGVRIGSPRLYSIGPSVIGWLRAWRRLVLAAELGYRLAPGVVMDSGVVGLIIHHVPLTFSAGWELPTEPILSLGLTAAADFKFPVSQYQSGFGVGVETGMFVQVRIALEEPAAHLMVRGTFALRPMRQQYLVKGATLAETPWVFGLAVGALWQ